MRFSGAIAVALIAGTAFAAEIPQAERRSGYDFMKPDTRAMQDEDAANPGMLWVLDGEALSVPARCDDLLSGFHLHIAVMREIA